VTVFSNENWLYQRIDIAIGDNRRKEMKYLAKTHPGVAKRLSAARRLSVSIEEVSAKPASAEENEEAVTWRKRKA